jgi:hypothetical protein
MPTIPFERTTAQIIDLDAASYTIATLTSNDKLARVPVALTAYKPAGDAFTVGAGCRLEVKDDDGNVLISLAAEGFLDQTTAQRRYTQAATSGRAFSGNSSTFTLSATAALSDGGSTVQFRFEFDEVPIEW